MRDPSARRATPSVAYKNEEMLHPGTNSVTIDIAPINKRYDATRWRQK